MPYSLRFVGVLLVLAALSAPISLGVQHQQSARQARLTAMALTGGDPGRGREAVRRYGCGACHQISGVDGATGRVGPPLDGLKKRPELAGKLSNDAPSLERWIHAPQSVQPGVGMPDFDMDARTTRDIAAYLYTL